MKIKRNSLSFGSLQRPALWATHLVCQTKKLSSKNHFPMGYPAFWCVKSVLNFPLRFGVWNQDFFPFQLWKTCVFFFFGVWTNFFLYVFFFFWCVNEVLSFRQPSILVLKLYETSACVVWYKVAKIHRTPWVARHFFAKEPLLTELFYRKSPVKTKHPIGLCHPVQFVHLCGAVWNVLQVCYMYKTSISRVWNK